MKKGSDNNLLIGVNDKVGYSKATVLGLQHVLAMDLYIAPLIIAGLLSLSIENTSFFIQMCFLATGIATLIQTGAGIKLPVVQGPSYVPIGAIAAIGGKLGLGGITGSLIPGAIIIAIVGYPLKWFAKWVRKFMPPIVAGTVIIIVGIGLMPTAINGVYNAEGSLGHNTAIAGVSIGTLILFMMLGSRLRGIGKFFRLVSVILAIAVGTITATILGDVDFSPVKDAPWFAFPALFPFGKPVFDIGAIITMVFVYLIILIETTGTWFVVSSVTGEQLDDKRLNKASVGEGLGCLAGSLVGGTPVTGYSSNAGLLAITGVAGRGPILAAGVILICLGLIPKLSTVITCIPGPVISAIFGMVCVAIVTNGMKVIQPFTIDDRNMIIIGIPILLTLAAVFLPQDVLFAVPDWINYILSSGIAVGALATLILNLVIPKEKKMQTEREDALYKKGTG
ncbi:uracil-xanthine permease family protein [Siminovitchia sediminis]|uniref:Uracil-xanthine permease family protein n=1 Tax=Siminovitchia sediminis TaxID=1274353 RepID=A0ABW4KEV1_9BACI